MKRILLLFISTVVIIISGCKKTDQFLNTNLLDEKQIIEQFTKVPDNLNPSLQKISNYIHEKDKQNSFIVNIGKKVGMPIWDKAQFKKTKIKNVAARSNELEDTTVIIPLSLPNSYEVSGFISAVLDENNNVKNIREYDKFNYYLLGFNNTGLMEDAEDVVMQCLVLQKEVFGISNFKLLDSRLFNTNTTGGDEIRKSFEISLSDVTQSSSENVRVVVVKYNHCTQHDGIGPNGHEGGDCDECDWCGKYSYDIIYYESPFDTGGGGGSGGFGGQFGGGNGGWSSSGTTVLNGANFVSTVSTLDVTAINDITASNNFKAVYTQLEEIYKARPVGLYSSMSRDNFIAMLQQNPTLAKYIDPITLLVKLGANAASDVLMQVMIVRLTDPNVHSWGDAIDKVDWVQVGATALSSLLPWNNPASKFIVAGINGASAVISDLTQNGFQSWENSGLRFIEGFCASLIGNAAGDFIITKFGSVKNFGSLLVTKMGNHFPYKTICYWLGGGLQQINKSFVHNGKTITANRMMKGFAENKVAVIGRNMDGRVKPFVDKLSNELGIPILRWQGFDDKVSDKINVLNNRAWIKALKEEGYTFYDIGLDPFYTSQGIFDEGLFYSMELDEIFR